MKTKHKKNNAPFTNSELIIYGRHAVLAALSNPKRKISKLLCTAENLAEATRIGRISPQVVEKRELDKLLGESAVHQGWTAFAQRLDDWSLDDLLAAAENTAECHILILDQVTDPQNIGAIIRTAVAFDTLALVVQDKNSPCESGAMDKAAAGMIEHLPIVRAVNLARAIERLKEAGFWIIGMDGYAKLTPSELKKGGKTAIVMGSEGKGMRRLIEESCDIAVRLPISAKVESLNVGIAAAIALYEINRK
ncbi:MAG: 23S rRNA (guanosine(2251)-2'-O)-methyltransferase RlmB [Alphaproteobacteria bacterium]|nr:23S rRNA (guanosine(2251)-2'-O)-methyltransferase RlmB [Alphaproteobacteria bacterium]